MEKGGFVLRAVQGIRYYSCSALAAVPGLRHGFSTRIDAGSPPSCFNLGYTSWDSAERVDANRRRFLSALKLEHARLATVHQVHSNRVHIIDDGGTEWNRPEADALVTRASGIVLAVQVADCLPVLLADPAKRALAAVHSGWRGTLSGILPAAIAVMKRSFGCRPADLLVAVGPGIRTCCMEVGGEVAELFEKKYPNSIVSADGGKFRLNLVGVLEAQMDAEGIPADNRRDLGACTRCNPAEYFSYRAEGAASGRMMAAIAFE